MNFHGAYLRDCGGCCFYGSEVLAYAAVAAAVVGTATSVYGQSQAAEAQKKNAEYQAQVAANNATIANQSANAAIQAGNEKEQEKGLQAREQLASVTAAEAASGVDTSSGSAVDVQQTRREVGQLDTAQEAHNAALQAYGYRTQQTSFQAESGLQQSEAQQAGTAGAVGAAGSLLQGAGSLGLKWAGLQSSAAPDEAVAP